MSIARRVLGLAAAVGLLLQLCGCAPLQPWVKPYERERLADPIMTYDRNPSSAAYMEHLFDVRSGSRGGDGAAGGGCGCN
jgi:hypothetical protein